MAPRELATLKDSEMNHLATPMAVKCAVRSFLADVDCSET